MGSARRPIWSCSMRSWISATPARPDLFRNNHPPPVTLDGIQIVPERVPGVIRTQRKYSTPALKISMSLSPGTLNHTWGV